MTDHLDKDSLVTQFAPRDYLAGCETIDLEAANIVARAAELREAEVLATAKRCFEFVRDEIKHSGDFRMNPVTCRASEVLKHETGYCYAKSHLLCALLRANKIPAGLCYQRLKVSDQPSQFVLHGLNAVYLPTVGWYRVDARGNRDDVDARFDPPQCRLAFDITEAGERDLPQIFVSPLPAVLACLSQHDSWESVAAHLPDVSTGAG